MGSLCWPSFFSFFSLRGEPSVTFLFFIFSLFYLRTLILREYLGDSWGETSEMDQRDLRGSVLRGL